MPNIDEALLGEMSGYIKKAADTFAQAEKDAVRVVDLLINQGRLDPTLRKNAEEKFATHEGLVSLVNQLVTRTPAVSRMGSPVYNTPSKTAGDDKESDRYWNEMVGE